MYHNGNRYSKSPRVSFGCCLASTILSLVATISCPAQQLKVIPYKPTGIYDVGERLGWRIKLPEGNEAKKNYSYTIKKNNLDVISSGTVDLTSGGTSVELTVNEPAMLYLELSPRGTTSTSSRPIVAGAAVAPKKLQPIAPRPDDFDAFWAAKIEQLKETAENVVLKSGSAGIANVDYATIRMDNFDGSHIHGQLAKPQRDGKLPALVIFQWASPPYPLQKEWVTSHAANGWLTLNIEPHDVLPDQPPEYYQSLPESIRHYESIGNDDRERSYFLRMYLGDYRAIDYITSRPDWDGKTLVVMGISMGGQQGLCVAGLHPKITHLIVDVPAGCDTNGPLHGRQSSYPNFPSNNPKIMQTALYFDAVNFAPRIRATSLVAMGFVDNISAPAGIWTAFNLIPGPKEAVPMVDSPHNHLATPEQQRPYTDRSADWLKTLAKGEQVTPRDLAATRSQTPTPVDDHHNMMDQLNIKKLRPGADSENQEIFNEATANEFSDTLPDVLTMNDGTKVTDPAQWRKRRAEILEQFAKEIYGRIPDNVPNVKWEVTETKNEVTGNVPTVSKSLIGHVDSSSYPQFAVDIRASFTVPANAEGPVPIMIEFGRGRIRRNFDRNGAAVGTPWTEQAIANGWGYGFIDPNSIQADNGSMLRSGVIGLTNKGGPRKPDDWGALRAWQWGVSRLIDYFEANPDSKVDPAKVGIEGVSRFGKAALVTQAFDERVAVGVIASSGAGGAKLYRHIFGETVENLAGGEYYWMAGNFMKFAAAESKFGPKTTADLPIDSHELIAACAPRPCFISYGTVEHGDPQWVDARGSFMSAVLASPVYELLGKGGLGTKSDYLSERLPPVGQLVGGELAWRQHDGGHDVTPNWPTFFEWVGRYIEVPSAAPSNSTFKTSGSVPPLNTSNNGAKGETPLERTDANSKLAHQQLLEKAGKGRIDVYFLGDSITRRWGCTDPQYADFLKNWKSNFFGWNAANFGWGGDTTQNILWRLENGELDNVRPKVIIILAGTNNLKSGSTFDEDVTETTNGIRTIVALCQKKAPQAKIILTAIFPRNDHVDLMPKINRINENIANFADGSKVLFLNVNDRLADKNDTLFDGMMADKLHPTLKGYQVWADGFSPILTEILGPRAGEDHAPPPTGDPSAR